MPPFKPYQLPLDLPCGRAPRSAPTSRPARPAPDLVPADLVEFVEPAPGRPAFAQRPAPRTPRGLPAPRPMPPMSLATRGMPAPLPGSAPPWAAFRLGPAYLQPPARGAPAVRSRGLALGAPTPARAAQGPALTPRQIEAIERTVDGAGALGGVVLGVFRTAMSPDPYLDVILPSGARAVAPVLSYGDVGPYTPWQDPAQTGAYPVADLRMADPRMEPGRDDAWRITLAEYKRTADARRPVWGSPEKDHAHTVLVALRNGWPVPAAVLHDYPAFRIVYSPAQKTSGGEPGAPSRQRSALTLTHSPEDGTTLTLADASPWSEADTKHLMDAYYKAVGARRVSWLLDAAGRRQLYEDSSEGHAVPRLPLAEMAAELARRGFPQITVVEPAPVSDDEARRRGDLALKRRQSSSDVVLVETGRTIIAKPGRPGSDRLVTIGSVLGPRGFRWDEAARQWSMPGHEDDAEANEELLTSLEAGFAEFGMDVRVERRRATPSRKAAPPPTPAPRKPTQPDVIVTEVGGGFSVIASNQRDLERVAHGIAFLGLTWNANQHYWHTARANRTIQEREDLLSKITSGLARGGLTFHVKFASPTGRLNPTPIAAAPEERGRTAKLGARAKVGQKGAMTDETTPAPTAPPAAPRPSRAAPAAPRPSRAAPVPDAPVRLGHGIVIPAPAPLASMKMPSRKIPDDVMDVLRETRREGPRVFLPGQLERKLYEKTAEVLESIGAKWKRGSKKEPGAHVFADPERQVEFENLVSAGAYTTDSDLAYFATPSDLAERIVGMAGPLAGKNVLEPSAGEGAIVYWLLRSGARVTAVEFEPRRAKALESRYPNITTIVGDFLAIPAPVPPSFDAVVMNPPFSLPGRRHADIDHVLHATRFLKPGGTMVAIMLGSIAQPASDAQAREFRAFVDSIGGTMEPVPAGAFKESGTLVPTVIVRFTLPAAHAAPSPKRLTTKAKRSP